MTVAIELLALSKTYREGFWGTKAQAVKEISFSVNPGQIFGFLGANGAGKTTCIKILMGLQFATSGKALLFGKNSEEKSSRANVGYLPERPYFHENLTANEFLNFHRELANNGGRLGKRTNEELLKIAGLTVTPNKLLRGFSKGMLQRLGIAQTLLHDPDLIILDEPMSGLDPIGRRDIRNLILDLAHQGKTIFFSTHILGDAESLCNEIAFLEKGVLKYTGKLSPLLAGNAEEIEIVYAGEPIDNAKKAGDNWKATVKDEAASKALIQEIWRRGGSLKSCTRAQKNLEEALYGGSR